jgi:hypothetical protein
MAKLIKKEREIKKKSKLTFLSDISDHGRKTSKNSLLCEHNEETDTRHENQHFQNSENKPKACSNAVSIYSVKTDECWFKENPASFVVF